MYLCYWMQQSGLADLLTSLHEAVYVRVRDGSMVSVVILAALLGLTLDLAAA